MILIFVILLVLVEGGGLRAGKRDLTINTFWKQVQDGNVSDVHLREGSSTVHVVLSDDPDRRKIPVNFHGPESVASVEEELRKYPSIAVKSMEASFFTVMLPYFLPFLLLVVIFYFLFITARRQR